MVSTGGIPQIEEDEMLTRQVSNLGLELGDSFVEQTPSERR